MCQAFKVVAGIESGPGAFQWPLGASSAKPRPGRLLSTRSYSLTTTPDPYWGNEFEWTTTTRLPSPSAAVTTDVPPPPPAPQAWRAVTIAPVSDMPRLGFVNASPRTRAERSTSAHQ